MKKFLLAFIMSCLLGSAGIAVRSADHAGGQCECSGMPRVIFDLKDGYPA